MAESHQDQGTTRDSPESTNTLAVTLARSDSDATGDEGLLPPGSSVGPYRIDKLLGQGGMGQVYLAEQQQPVVRPVALKLLPAESMSSRQIAWFSIESQMLASMHHPGIAQVYDAGTTDHGQPYFAMEYVDGQTLINYCKNRELTLAQRLSLFIRICQGVQHAHQRGVIHRDLKPANILVAEVDGQAQPKIIDFGVATVAESQAGGASIEAAGTPQYMSPEQGGEYPSRPDSRSDVYSLGRVLFELLSGQLPPTDSSHFRSRLHRDATDHSTVALSALPQHSQQQILARRGRLWGRNWLLRELDWVIARATAHEREGRYNSAGDLAADLQRLLDMRPLEAAPASRWYTWRKFLARNRLMVASASAVGLALVLGLTAATAGFIQASRERDAAERARVLTESVNQFLVQDILAAADIEVSAAGGELTVRQALDNVRARVSERFAGEPLIEAGVRHSMATSYRGLGEVETAHDEYSLALALRRQHLGWEHPDTLAAAHDLAGILQRKGEFERAEVMFTNVFETREKLLGERHPDTLRSLNALGVMYWQWGRYQRALPITERALNLATAIHDEPHREIYTAMHNLGRVYRGLERGEEAVPLMQTALDGRRELFGDDSLITLEARADLAGLYRGLGEYQQSAELYREIVDVYRRVAGERHGATLVSMNNLARVYGNLGEHEQSAQLLAFVVEHAPEAFGEGNWHVAAFQMNLAIAQIELGQAESALALIDQAERPLVETFPEDHPRVLMIEQYRERARALVDE